MANSVDPDQMPHSAASDLGLYCLLWPVCPNTSSYYGSPIPSFSFWISHSSRKGTFYQPEIRHFFLLFPKKHVVGSH